MDPVAVIDLSSLLITPQAIELREFKFGTCARVMAGWTQPWIGMKPLSTGMYEQATPTRRSNATRPQVRYRRHAVISARTSAGPPEQSLRTKKCPPRRRLCSLPSRCTQTLAIGLVTRTGIDQCMREANTQRATKVIMWPRAQLDK